MRAAGADVIPLGALAWHCSYVDWLHPSAACVYLMAQGLASGLAAAWGVADDRAAGDGTEGTLFPLEPWQKGRPRPRPRRYPPRWWAGGVSDAAP
eukprot:gene51319-8805_t